MTRSNGQKNIDPFFESIMIIFPNKIVKKNTQCIKSYPFGPT